MAGQLYYDTKITWRVKQWVGRVCTGLQKILEVNVGGLIGEKYQVFPHDVSGVEVIIPRMCDTYSIVSKRLLGYIHVQSHNCY